MATPPLVPISAAPAPPTKLQNILQIINAALQGLQLVPVVGPFAGLANIFLGILQNGLATYQAETGQPLDLTKIPQEALLP